MPTYDYECDACGHTFELFQGINDSVKRKCPECGRLKLKRLFGTGAAIVFKGSGFYQTDYRSDSYKQGAEAEKKASEKKGDKAAKTESKSSESKSAAKSEAAPAPSKPSSGGADK